MELYGFFVRAETARGCRPIALGCGNGGSFAEFLLCIIKVEVEGGKVEEEPADGG